MKAPPGLDIHLFIAGSLPGWGGERRRDQEAKEAEGTWGLNDLQTRTEVFDVLTAGHGLDDKALRDYPPLYGKKKLMVLNSFKQF